MTDGSLGVVGIERIMEENVNIIELRSEKGVSFMK